MADQQGSTADTSVSTEGTEVTGEVTQQVEVVDAPQETNANQSVEPWADLVADMPSFSEEELTGLDSEAGEEATDVKQEAATTSESEAETSDEQGTEAQEGETQQAATDEPPAQESDETAPEKEPEGYVKLEALHQARGENRYLKSKITQLEAEKLSIQEKAAQPAWMADFKKLNTEELRDLMADDADAAVQYAERLSEFNTFEREQEAKAKEAEALAETTEIGVNTAFERIESAVPGIYKDPEVNGKLADFAESIGFSENMFALTNPRNTISIDGAAPVPLGELSAGLVELLASLSESIDQQYGDAKPGQPVAPAAAGPAPDVEALTAAITEKVMAEVQGKVIGKLKGGESKGGVTTLSDVQNSGDEDFSTVGNLTQDQLEKLTPEQQQRYLSGIDQ